jgi:hypothetical protein
MQRHREHAADFRARCPSPVRGDRGPDRRCRPLIRLALWNSNPRTAFAFWHDIFKECQ